MTSSQSFFIQGPVGPLEVHVTLPENPSNLVTIMCHPHPLFGGTMDNKVITTSMRAMRDNNSMVVRFNFRGVGQSAGKFDQGKGETDDLIAVKNWVSQTYPNAAVWLLGFSFGAYVVSKCAQAYPDVEQLITIAPAVHHHDYQDFTTIVTPWLVVMGERDDVVPPQQVYDWVARMPANVHLIRISEADHFFHGKLVQLRQVLQTELFSYP